MAKTILWFTWLRLEKRQTELTGWLVVFWIKDRAIFDKPHRTTENGEKSHRDNWVAKLRFYQYTAWPYTVF
jgi:hypothetical protein